MPRVHHIKPYIPPRKYTEAELDAAARRDLETDLRCAERDGLVDYAERLRRALARIDGGESAHKVVFERNY
jgi:hypothetical protein